MYRLTFRHILSTDFIESSKHANVQIDKAHSLLNVSNKNAQCNSVNINTINNSMVNIQALECNLEDFSELEEFLEAAQMLDTYIPVDVQQMRDFDKIPVYEMNAITFFAGYIAFKAIEKTPCLNCEILFCKYPEDSLITSETYTQLLEYEHSEIMKKENVISVAFLTRATEIFTRIVLVNWKHLMYITKAFGI